MTEKKKDAPMDEGKQEEKVEQVEQVLDETEQPQATAEEQALPAEAQPPESGVSEKPDKPDKEDCKRKWYAVTAEYENYRKRTANTRAQAYAEGRADVVSKLFPIADNLDRALASCNDEKTRKGIEMVMKSFEKLLREEKITTIDPIGEEFSAETCEAIMAVDPAEGEQSGIVKQVYLKGYEQNGKVLRFAQVVVTK
jgi:molecular chaperone GrpE